MLPGKVKLTLFVLWMSASFGKALSNSCSYVTDSKKWFLTGVCTVTTIYKKGGWCQMKASFKPHEEVFGNLTSVELSNSGAYFWNCSARLELTSLNGLHNYEVRFAAVVPNWRPAFTVRIADPGQPILKNCPEHVTEGESVTCECSSERDGEPRPIFSWPGHTDSSLLRLYDVTDNDTYSCEMYWGKQTRTVSYSLLVTPGKNASTSSAQIVGVVVAAVLLIIIVTTIVVIFIIRKKRDAWARISSTKSRLSEVVLSENLFYGDFEVDSGREVNEDSSMQGGKSLEPDVYSAVENDGRRLTMSSDLYANVEMNAGRQTTQVELYAAVEKDKDRQVGQHDLYAAVVKSKGKQKAKANKSRSAGAKQDFTNKGDKNAAVDKGANPEIQGEETYAQVIKPAK
ncbi:uncharacterized protein LOC112568678 isoform X2 [Pomacea canaliculata]|uniref:uncharacterized protein LOC112568678 isoform X2 n=1 Tax=Pomacea canaliculata TaxID=400727 RepID=UPI000D73C7AC|nr:uncharacterized protein LOC112568678 isoform X2 [Pomacea canaliculata]